MSIAATVAESQQEEQIKALRDYRAAIARDAESAGDKTPKDQWKQILSAAGKTGAEADADILNLKQSAKNKETITRKPAKREERERIVKRQSDAIDSATVRVEQNKKSLAAAEENLVAVDADYRSQLAQIDAELHEIWEAEQWLIKNSDCGDEYVTAESTLNYRPRLIEDLERAIKTLQSEADDLEEVTLPPLRERTKQLQRMNQAQAVLAELAWVHGEIQENEYKLRGKKDLIAETRAKIVSIKAGLPELESRVEQLRFAAIG
jgi:hypothetical protein